MAKTNPVVQVEVKAVLPTSGGCAVFLGNARKIFVIYIDHSVGLAITLAMRQEPKERPQTHDLIGSIMAGLGAKVQRVVINHFKDGVYYARLILEAENELHARKILELDARPSDSIALAVQGKAPIYITREVWEGVEDMTAMYQKMESQGFQFSPEEPEG
ncbi:MAG: bifunctional nuclease family protein [Verrucomicrobiota bacterium]